MEGLKRLRTALNLTQAELAKEVGVTQSQVAQWERGATMPSALKLPALAHALHCTIDDLFREQDGSTHGPGGPAPHVIPDRL